MISATNKMMDYLALRDHSEKELRKKLKAHYTPEEIEAAITYGKANHWVAETPEEQMALSVKTAAALRRKGKGSLYINNYLQERGMAEVPPDHEAEKEKALEIVRAKFKKLTGLDQKEKAKIGRFLASRGFNLEVVNSVVFDGELERLGSED